MKEDTNDASYIIYINIIGIFVPEIGTIVYSPYFYTHKLLIERRHVYKLSLLTILTLNKVLLTVYSVRGSTT